MDEKVIYEAKRFWRPVKAWAAVMSLAGFLGLAGLLAVLYAFHLDPDVTVTETVVNHTCGHPNCVPHAGPLDVSYGSGEIAWSGVLYLIWLFAAGLFAGHWVKES
jgi:hypothetical protein